eukprot:755993-Hanusia_phi.AAC.1
MRSFQALPAWACFVLFVLLVFGCNKTAEGIQMASSMSSSSLRMYRPRALSMSKGLQREKAMRSISENFSTCTSTEQEQEQEQEQEKFSNEILGIIHDVMPDSPAAKAGLQSGEKLISIGRVDFSVIERAGNRALVEEINSHEEKPLMMVVLGSNGYLRYVKVVPCRWEGEGLLGCTVVMTLERRSRSLTPARGHEVAMEEVPQETGQETGQERIQVMVEREASYPSNMVAEEMGTSEGVAARPLAVPVLSQGIKVLKVVAIPVGFLGGAACKICLLPLRLQFAVIDPFLALQVGMMMMTRRRRRRRWWWWWMRGWWWWLWSSEKKGKEWR